MADVWDKLDAYTKSDHLNSSDEENEEFQELLQKVDNAEVQAKQRSAIKGGATTSEQDAPAASQSGNLHQNLLSEMRESKLHNDTESRNVQGKIDEISSEKKKQKGELTEMHHKAQVISKSARMSATQVLFNIASSETMDVEENTQTEEYLNKIRSVETENDASVRKSVEAKSSSPDIDLPDIPPVSTSILNTGVMKSRVNVARQGSMKARRKPTHRKSWTPGIDQLSFPEQETSAENTISTDSNIWVLPQSGQQHNNQEPGTPSDSSSSEDEKETPAKPHMKSGVALPGLFDVDKIQLQKSELKRPTALTLVKSAKDAKEHQVTKEDKPDMPSPKPDWMKEVEKRKKDPKARRRRHVTLPARCSELEKLFEQRKNEKDQEEGNIESAGLSQDDAEIVREDPHPKIEQQDSIDPQLRKLFEKRRQLKPMEDVVVTNKEPTRPKSLHLESTPSELDQIFKKRRALQNVEGPVQGEPSRAPQGFHGKDHHDGARVVHGRQYDGKLEPLPVTGEVKIAKISEVRSKDRGRTSLAGMAEASQVVQFTPDMTAGTRAVVGRIPSAGTHRPPSRLGQNAGQDKPVVVRYEEQSYTSPSIVSASPGTPRTTAGHSAERPRHNKNTPASSGRKNDLAKNNGSYNVLIAEQTVLGLQNTGKNALNMSKSVTRVTPTTQATRRKVAKASQPSHNNHNSHGNVHQSPYTPSPNSYPRSQANLPHTLPPIVHPHPAQITKPNPPPSLARPGTITQNQKRDVNRHLHDKHHPPPSTRVRNVTSPVRTTPSNNHDPFMAIENRLSHSDRGQHGTTNGPSISHVTPESYNEPNYKRLSNGHLKSVTVTVSSITETPVRVKVARGPSGGREESPAPSGNGGGDMFKQNIARDGFTRGNSPKNNAQNQQSTNSDVPKWKLELQQKKRLQAEKQTKSSDKENIKSQHPAQNDSIAEWQKRLQGMRKKWGHSTEDGDVVKDNNDNVQDTPQSDGSGESSSFIQGKKTKQKVNKVTVTAKSTQDSTDKTTADTDAGKSSSKHELGTYV